MQPPGNRRGIERPWTILGAVIVAGGLIALWVAFGSPFAEPDARPEATKPSPAPAAAPDTSGSGAPPAAPSAAPAPAQRIPEHGRLRVTRDALREGDVLALGLGMPDEARGQGPRPVKIAGMEGHVIETQALPVRGPGSGVRLEIDPEWLIPGVYLIEVKTAEPQPLALRRYVLEVVAPEDVAD